MSTEIVFTSNEAAEVDQKSAQSYARYDSIDVSIDEEHGGLALIKSCVTKRIDFSTAK